MDKTYLELLAENDAEARKEFEPNAKELLTVNFVEYDDDIEAHGPQHDELEDQHEFQKPQGSHQLASLMPEPAKDVHKTTTSVRYDKDVQIHVISIDSRFRTDLGENASNFLFKLLTPIKNVISIRLSSLEIPNTWYTFSDIRGNTSMVVIVNPPTTGQGIEVSSVSARVVITSGNYTVNTGYQNDILIELFNQLNSAFDDFSFGVRLSPITGKITMSCVSNPKKATEYTYDKQPSITGDTNYSINFADGIFSNRDTNWGLGYNLGFNVYQTPVGTSQTGTYLVDTLDSNYIFLSLNPDWRVVEHNQPDSTQTSAFAKVIVDVPKNDIVYDSGANTITKQYFLKQPTNISTFNISIVDEYEQYIQLEGGNISLTLEVTEVLHSSLYEAMRA